MTLVSIKNELIKAREARYAVPLFDVFEQQGMDGTLDALIKRRAPTIIGLYSSYTQLPNIRALVAYIRSRAEETDVPVAIMLDHGASPENCLQMIEYGITDVMYDGSKLPLEENIANTKKVVAAAHAAGVAVEAELGHVGMGDQYESFGSQRVGFTNPDVVEYFVKETGIDFLAIAFGNAHGFYKGKPQLDLDLVAAIRERVSVPLVMHGGTGLTDEQFRGAIAAGICKINFATSILNGAVENMKATAMNINPSGTADANMFALLYGVREAYCSWTSQLYDVFGTTNRA